MIDAHILMTDSKHFKNLHLHENRLRRQYQQDAKVLTELQAQRKKEQEEQEQAKKTAVPKTLTAAANGFEFTTPAEPIERSQSRERSDRFLINSDPAQAAPTA
jgi:hypothetical protein